MSEHVTRAAPPPPALPAVDRQIAARRQNVVTRVIEGRFGPFVGLSVASALLLIVVAATQDAFLTQANMTNIMRTAAVTLVLAAGMTLVLLTAGVDLSVGAILALCAVLYGQLVAVHGMNEWLALLVTLAAGAALGLVNGLLIGLANMSFFVVTLGTLSLFRGLALLWESDTVDMFGREVPALLGNDAVLGDTFPISILIALGVCVLLAFVLRSTRYGRSIYATGGNREAAELSGVRTGWIVVSVYVVSGLCAALGAVMLIGRTTTAVATQGTGIELSVVAAVLLGGAALSGGAGSIWGTVLAVGFLQVLANSLNLAAVSGFWQQIVTGSILIAAIYLDSVRTRRLGS